MRFRWDWLRPVVPVPYVPTLGPVHPSVLTEDLFTDTLIAAPTKMFLHYDKDIRWSEAKHESVLEQDIVHAPDGTLIPTVTRRGAGAVKVHVYGSQVSMAVELAQKLAAVHGARRARVVRFRGPEALHGVGTRVQLKDFRTSPCPAPQGVVLPYSQTPWNVRRTFAEFAHTMAADGFSFLHGRMLAGEVGPVLVASRYGQVAGAIGPMEVRRDAVGSAQLMPQYFGVLPQYRGHGIGRDLWRAAMQWGHRNGAEYQLLQTEAGKASDRLCQSEGLQSLGFVYATDVNL
ncbi:GNAT family N-acetyltransferase [Streptomyces sp. PA5.6]|uniref:GNAT family N-acetyltransferase n=1 Tax=Streptomyces sp. PA5.6 TaxID=3035651 RepID=UPI003904A8CA